MMRLRAIPYLAVLGLLLVAGCHNADAPSAPVRCADDHVCVTGTVRFITIEGGFWAVRGDDGVTYDPLSGLTTGFRVEGLRVYMVARERRDAVSFHMAGPLVDILAIERLR